MVCVGMTRVRPSVDVRMQLRGSSCRSSYSQEALDASAYCPGACGVYVCVCVCVLKSKENTAQRQCVYMCGRVRIGAAQCSIRFRQKEPAPLAPSAPANRVVKDGRRVTWPCFTFYPGIFTNCAPHTCRHQGRKALILHDPLRGEWTHLGHQHHGAGRGAIGHVTTCFGRVELNFRLHGHLYCRMSARANAPGRCNLLGVRRRGPGGRLSSTRFKSRIGGRPLAPGRETPQMEGTGGTRAPARGARVVQVVVCATCGAAYNLMAHARHHLRCKPDRSLAAANIAEAQRPALETANGGCVGDRDACGGQLVAT